MIRSVLSLALAAACAACATPAPMMPSLATAEVAADFETYRLKRVGVMPFAGPEVTPEQSHALQLALHAEISRSTPYEVVLLAPDDVAEVDASEPYRRGWYLPRTIITLSRRYSLDAILFGTVTQQRSYPPLSLSLQADLVSAETGLVIWTSSVHMDTNDPEVREGLEAYYGSTAPEGFSPGWEVGMLSPERFARFAAYQIARVL